MTQKKVTLLEALIPITVLIVMLTINVFLFDDSLSGPNQMALLFGAAVAIFIGLRHKFSFEEMFKGVSENIGSTSSALIILLLIGSLAGTWLISGIVPAMVYYGLKILNPEIFLAVSVVVSALVSLATGSSWSTIATVGIALLGIGKALGLPEGMIGGAIISGAYFGDKMSPLSDTTNLAPAMAGTDIVTHIRYMALTTVPTISITIIVFLLMGLFYEVPPMQSSNDSVLAILEDTFNITPWLFLVPAAVIYMIVKKIPAIPALFMGTLLGGVFAYIFQPQMLQTLAGSTQLTLANAYTVVMNSMTGETSIVTDSPMLNELLHSGGMAGMLNTIWLIVTAMVFGGVMESIKALEVITERLLKFTTSQAGIITTTSATCVFFNVTASDQYLAIVVPGRMFSDAYKKKGLAPENLSRTLEDSATVTSVLIPWNTCGVAQSSVLGVATLTYAPWAIFNWLSPLMTILFAWFNIKIKKLKSSPQPAMAMQ